MTNKEIKDIINKKGGIQLVKQYWRGGAFFTSAIGLLLLGRKRDALELIQMMAAMKVKQRLEKKYKGVLEEFDRSYDENLPHEHSSIIWFCWFQGLDNAPPIVRKCYESLRENIKDKQVIVITQDNMAEYVSFPQAIQKKIDSGIIKGAHLSDLLRLELIIRHGGTWIDATVFCSGTEIPDYMFESELFMFQTLKPGKKGHVRNTSNWYISAASNNKMLMAVQTLLYHYWEQNDELVDYFIFHDFFSIVIDKYPEEWTKVVPFSNATPHILLLRLFDKFDERIWDAIRHQTPFHKLSYKYSEGDAKKEGTYFQKLFY